MAETTSPIPAETSNIEVKLSESSLETNTGPSQPKDEKLVQAEKFKDEGNVAFKEQNFAKATELYSLAIENNPNEASFYGNRSFAYIKSEFYGRRKFAKLVEP